MYKSKASPQYEVLSPWAEADPIPLKGLAPRIANLEGKRIGLYRNGKITAEPILAVIEAKLKEMFPTCETSWYRQKQIGSPEIDGGRKSEFEDWLKEVDAVIAAVGD